VKVPRRHIEQLEAKVPDFYEFFAGGGMVRAGLSTGWDCLFANDFDHKKSSVYRRNWRDSALRTADIRTLSLQDIPSHADLAWASFPCQDLSLAGGGAGLKGDRSGTFWPFWSLMKKLIADDRAPRIIALENVCGTLTSHDGKDFAAICATFDQVNYSFGALVIDAALFVPQSRPRLFIIGVRNDVAIPAALRSEKPSPLWHSRGLLTAHEKTPTKSLRNWIWWALPNPPGRKQSFSDLIVDEPSDVNWHTPAETRALLHKMSDVNLAKVETAKKARRRIVGAIYKRTRHDENGFKVQRAEVRFDDVAGCLRTPAGGSSRQLILVVEGQKVRSRLVSGRETARLMGLDDKYKLPDNYNEAYHLTGDGVVVPVVRHLAEHIFEPILLSEMSAAKVAA
jgi:DNA (cytosine-5)-methyltransferase 1